MPYTVCIYLSSMTLPPTVPPLSSSPPVSLSLSEAVVTQRPDATGEPVPRDQVLSGVLNTLAPWSSEESVPAAYVDWTRGPAFIEQPESTSRTAFNLKQSVRQATFGLPPGWGRPDGGGVRACRPRKARARLGEHRAQTHRKPVGLLVCPPAACSAMSARRFGPP